VSVRTCVRASVRPCVRASVHACAAHSASPLPPARRARPAVPTRAPAHARGCSAHCTHPDALLEPPEEVRGRADEEDGKENDSILEVRDGDGKRLRARDAGGQRQRLRAGGTRAPRRRGGAATCAPPPSSSPSILVRPFMSRGNIYYFSVSQNSFCDNFSVSQ